jgi:hypothetical protein
MSEITEVCRIGGTLAHPQHLGIEPFVLSNEEGRASLIEQNTIIQMRHHMKRGPSCAVYTRDPSPLFWRPYFARSYWAAPARQRRSHFSGGGGPE